MIPFSNPDESVEVSIVEEEETVVSIYHLENLAVTQISNELVEL